MIKQTLEERRDKAYLKAKPLIKKYESLSFKEQFKFIKSKRQEWKDDHHFIHRYYNLVARCEGYARGMVQVNLKDLQEEINK